MTRARPLKYIFRFKVTTHILGFVVPLTGVRDPRVGPS